jgi:hypothetical protein
VFDVHNDELEKIQPMITRNGKRFKLEVPLVVD